MLGDGDFTGLNTRTVIVLDENNTVLYIKRVSKLTNEPNYEAIWAVLAQTILLLTKKARIKDSSFLN